MNRYFSPAGDLIIGTSERVYGTALISGINEDGTPEYDGETDIDWDSQETLTKDGKDIFICDSGHEWTFDQLVVEVEEDDDANLPSD